jgi:hypothetical protein
MTREAAAAAAAAEEEPAEAAVAVAAAAARGQAARMATGVVPLPAALVVAAPLLIAAALLIAASLLIAACAPKPAEPLPAVPEIAHPAGMRAPISNPLRIRAPRPDVTFPDVVPDLAEEPRWPLTGMQHPSLQPSFDVADALAEPGITWTDLCARNVDRRRDPAHRDELLYLAGWCAAQRHETAAAVGLLAQVRDSAVPGIARAVPFDVADILVDCEDAEHADQILTQAQLRSAALYDVLAAAYFEIGRTDDALQATTSALQLDARRENLATCHRFARAALLSPKASRDVLVDELARASRRKPPDPACEELAAAVSCVVHPFTGCADYRSLHPVDHGLVALAAIADEWSDARSWSEWMLTAQEIRNTVTRPETATMLSDALDAAVVASECQPDTLKHIAQLILDIAAGSQVARAMWLASLWQKPDECARFRTRWLADHPQ